MIKKYIVEKMLNHNIADLAEFADEEKAFNQFVNMTGERKIGICTELDSIFLLTVSDLQLPQVIEINESIAVEERLWLQKIREEWILKSVTLFQEQWEQNINQRLDEMSSPFAARQKRPDFKKEIGKRVQSSKRVFINHRMDGYDFREVLLEDAIFINCSLKMCNFSHVNLQNTVFVNCDLEGSNFYNAFVNNSFVYQTEKVISLKKIQERSTKWPV